MVFQVTAGDGSVRLMTRGAATAATTGGCQLYHLAPIPGPDRAAFSGFDEFVAELEHDPQAATAIAQGREWLAEAVGNQDLASLRLSAGLSQAQLAAKCDMQQPHISRYESGKHEPSLGVCRVMAHALGVSMEALHDAWLTSRAANEKGSK